MSIVASAPAANPADITNTALQMFTRANVEPAEVCALALPGSGVLDGEPFTVVATGYVESVDGTDVTVRLLQGADPDPANNVVLGVSGEAACAAGQRVAWSISARLLYVVEAGTIQGEVLSNMAGVYSGPVALTTPIVDVPTGADPVMHFSVAVQVAAVPPPPPPEAEPAPDPEPQAGEEPPYVPPPALPGTPKPLPPVTTTGVYMILFGIASA